MKKIKLIEKHRDKRWFKFLKISGIFLACLILLSIISFIIYSFLYQGRVYLGIRLGDRHLGGKDQKQLEQLLHEEINNFNGQKISLVTADKSYELIPTEISLNYNISATAEDIFNYGRGWDLQSILKRTGVLFSAKKISAAYQYNDVAVSDKTKKIALELDQPEKDYSLKIVSGQIELLNDRASGRRLNQNRLIDDLRTNFNNLESKNINLLVEDKEPSVSLANAQAAKVKAETILKVGGLNLVYSDKNFAVDLETMGNWIATYSNGDDLVVDVNRDRVRDYLKTITSSIDVGPQDAMLTMTNGQISVYQPSRDGLTVDAEATLSKIVSTLISRFGDNPNQTDLAKVTIEVKVTKPTITNETLSSLGLKELIASGTTSFTGSPANRISNITVGARLINGALIKPGETFSTLSRLGKIDASTGFLPELVIKENRTVPEFGGGLCQVSTTLFRAALNAGVNIIERQNHRYRVSYYEPPVGMDATIYDPAPDFRFVNDTPGYILIQGRVSGTKITFEFYGTKDGRTVSMSAPVISDVTPPVEPIMEPSDTLPTGEQKQVEKAHDGATASFVYTVMKDGQQLHKNTFVSHYVPWPARFLVGTGPVAPAPTPPPVDPSATPAPTT